jgi:type II secretory pathway pseudopilin PulG
MPGVDSSAGGERGTALLTLLVMVVVLGLAASMAGQSLRALMQREREDELLWRGLQYRRAISSYYHVRHGAQQMYPAALEDLLLDPRAASKVRHLRRLYNDPMTGKDWEVIRDPAERIIGVSTSSTLAPFKQTGFPVGLESFEGKSSYSDWQFVFEPGEKQTPPGAAPQTKPQAQ